MTTLAAAARALFGLEIQWPSKKTQTWFATRRISAYPTSSVYLERITKFNHSLAKRFTGTVGVAGSVYCLKRDHSMVPILALFDLTSLYLKIGFLYASLLSVRASAASALRQFMMASFGKVKHVEFRGRISSFRNWSEISLALSRSWKRSWSTSSSGTVWSCSKTWVLFP